MISPDSRGQKHTGVVAEVVNGCFSQEQVGQDVAAKAVEHGTDPGGKGALARQLNSPCGKRRKNALIHSWLSVAFAKGYCCFLEWAWKGVKHFLMKYCN